MGGPHPHAMMEPVHMGSGHVSPMIGLDSHGQKPEHNPYHMPPQYGGH